MQNQSNERHTSVWKRIDSLEIRSITYRNLTHDERGIMSASEKSTNLENHQCISPPKINYNLK